MTLGRAAWPIVLVVAMVVAAIVNRIQMAQWSPGCPDVFTMPGGTSAMCAAPGPLDVPLFWLAPLAGCAAGYACRRLLARAMRSSQQHPA